MPTSFNYSQSTLVHQLTLASFLYFLNALGSAANQLINTGLIAQIALGIVYGPPLSDILPADWLETFQELGNLGLVLLVLQGICLYPLAQPTDLTSLKADCQRALTSCAKT